MRNLEFSKLIYFLSALPAEEQSLFRAYLHSPIFNEREEPRRLFDFIRKRCLQQPPRELNDAKALPVVWPKGDGDAAKLQKIKTLLMSLLVSFLEFRRWQGKPRFAKVGMLHWLNDVGDESYFDQYYRKIKSELEEAPQLGLEMLSAQFELEMTLLQHQQSFGARSKDNHLLAAQASMENLVNGHLLKFAFLLANQSMIVGAELPEWITDHIRRLRLRDLSPIPLLEIYFLLFATYGEDCTRQDLELLKERVIAHAGQCTRQEAFDIYTGTINNVSRYSKTTGENMLETIFELYQGLVEQVVHKLGGSLNPSHFKNVVFVGSRLGKFEWVAAFLQDCAAWLEGEDAATTLDYNHGILHFYKREFAVAIRYFNRVLVDVKDVFYVFDTRCYLLMCYFETEDIQGMESLAHSFRMLVERSDRVSELHKQGYLAFLRVFRKALGTPVYDAGRNSQLQSEIALLPLSPWKAWLTEKTGVLR
jgi:hypothetical protein